MRIRALPVSLILATTLLAPALMLAGTTEAATASPPTSGSGTIFVEHTEHYDSHHKKVVAAGATIKITRTRDNSPVMTGKTDRNGNYTFVNLPSGDEYHLHFTLHGGSQQADVYWRVPANGGTKVYKNVTLK